MIRGQAGSPFGVIEEWLREVLDPLVKAGTVRWATFGQMANAYVQWEKAHPGVDPRGDSTRGMPPLRDTVRPPRGAEVPAPNQPAQRSARGYMTLAVNVHDWRLVNDSADTVLRLVGIFEKHRVRGDFYLTAPVVERDVSERRRSSSVSRTAA